MATVKIHIPDQQAAALQAKAAAAGLTLAELMLQCDQNAPASEEDRAWTDAQSTGRETR